MKPRAKAMDLLARREYGFRELCQRLTRQYTDEDIIPVVEQLACEGLQSDKRYVIGFVRYKANQGYGPHYIRYQLQQTVDNETLIEHILDETDWLEYAKRVVLKQTSRSGQRLQKYMQNKGFPFALIQRAIYETQEERYEDK